MVLNLWAAIPLVGGCISDITVQFITITKLHLSSNDGIILWLGGYYNMRNTMKGSWHLGRLRASEATVLTIPVWAQLTGVTLAFSRYCICWQVSVEHLPLTADHSGKVLAAAGGSLQIRLSPTRHIWWGGQRWRGGWRRSEPNSQS